jgi:hypothetical protein
MKNTACLARRFWIKPSFAPIPDRFDNSRALVRPDKKLAGVEAKSIRKRFKEERFAAGANRAQIAKCSEIGLELNAFIALGLEAMKGVARDWDCNDRYGFSGLVFRIGRQHDFIQEKGRATSDPPFPEG